MPFQLLDDDAPKGKFELEEDTPPEPQAPQQEQDTIPRFMGKVKGVLPNAAIDTARAMVPGGAGYLGAGMGQSGPQQAKTIDYMNKRSESVV